MIDFKRTIKTKGDGYWSDVVKDVNVLRIDLNYIHHDDDGTPYGELRVFFDLESWNPNVDGLIYTDSLFIDTLGHELNGIGLAGHDVSYSEQGMQGSDFVSLDVADDFIDSWITLKENS